jgi:hypothetical protein
VTFAAIGFSLVDDRYRRWLYSHEFVAVEPLYLKYLYLKPLLRSPCGALFGGSICGTAGRCVASAGMTAVTAGDAEIAGRVGMDRSAIRQRRLKLEKAA